MASKQIMYDNKIRRMGKETVGRIRRNRRRNYIEAIKREDKIAAEQALKEEVKK
jgi:hypothetical protein